MHGRRQGGGEGCSKRRLLVRGMWPATRVEAATPPAQGPASPPFPSVPPLLTTPCLPAPTTPPAAAQKQEWVDSPRPVSPDSFVKDGREIRVGDCALFRAVDVPPFIGLIRWIEKQEEGYPKLRVSWLYRPVDVKLNKGIQLDAAPNEIFYSFHQDEASAVSLLHPCKVAFLRKGAELPAGTSSFVCWRVYDIDNKCLWWLTDRDYINERQEEVNRLLYRTRLEMHTVVQQGGRSPKRLNAPSASQQLKAGSDGPQNSGSSKGKKRERGEQTIDQAKRDRDRTLKTDDSESVNSKGDNIKSEIAKITEKGGLPHAEAVEKLIHLMQLDRTERKLDLAGRVLLADIITATESPDCLDRFVQLRGLPVFDDWLQEAHKGKSGDGGSPKETDKPMEDLLLALLRALAKLPINLTALQSCSIGKSVNHLRSNKNMEIQKKAKCLVENWKKRVDAEMKSNDLKAVVSGQAVSWPGKPGFPEISSAGNRRSGSSEPSLKSPVSQLSSSKALTTKYGATDAAVKSSTVISSSSKLQHVQPVNVVTNLKEQPSKSTSGTCGPELPTVKEEKSSSSSQSLNNSQSCSSEHAKTIGSSKDARSSTAASGIAGISGSSSRVHRRTNNGLLGSGIQKETIVARSSSLDRSLLQEKVSQSGTSCEKGADISSDQGNGHRLIVRFPNPGRSPARSASEGSFEDPPFTGSRASSPVLADKHEQTDRRVKMKTENSNPHLGADTNAESWQSNYVKGAVVSEKGDRSPRAVFTDGNRTTEEPGKDACTSRVACSSYANEKGVCSSETGVRNLFNPMNALIEIKYSEASHSLQAGDDTAMNLLASVAGEISKSELISSSASPRNSSANEQGCEGDNIGNLKVDCDMGQSQNAGPSNDVEKVTTDKNDKSGASLVAKEEEHQGDVNMLAENNLLSPDNKGTASAGPSSLPGIHSKAVESLPKTENREVESSDVKEPVDSKIDMVCAKVEYGCTTSSDVGTTLSTQYSLIVSNRKVLPAEVSPLCDDDKQVHGLLKSTGQKHLLGLSDSSEAIDRSGDSTAVKLDLKSSLSSLTAEVNKANGLLVGNTVLKEEEKKELSSTPSADGTKRAVPAGVPHGVANGISYIKETKDNSSESSSYAGPGGAVSQDTEHSTRHSSKKLSDDAAMKEDLVSSDDGSSFAAKTRSSATAKLDFDLNEGIPGDDGHQSEPSTSPAMCSSAIHLPRLLPFMSPITVAAPAKGPFVPPENLLRLKPETGWKGSAATSAFRPAEPRKTLEMTLSAPGISVSDAAGKHRPALDIDLNVADDQFHEEDVSQSSLQTTGSESGNTRRNNGPVRSVGIELDLNRADEVAESGQFMSNTSSRVEVPLLLSKQLPGVFSSTEANSSRDFDLNNGPTLDETGMEPAPRSLSSKVTSSIPFLPQVPGVRMNSAEMSISPWFASANLGAPVAMQSFLPSRGDQPHPVETAAGSRTQRIITSMPDGVQHGSDPYRAPVISNSPTMVFHPPAYQYAGFPFTPGVHLQAPGFSIGSASYANSSPAGVSYFPTIAPRLVGPTGALPAQHTRQYAINLPEGSSTVGHDSNQKWGRQGLDLNSGPGSVDVEIKDEQVPLHVRQNLIMPPHPFVEGHTRMYQMPGIGIKRKEPDGSWDAERSSYK